LKQHAAWATVASRGDAWYALTVVWALTAIAAANAAAVAGAATVALLGSLAYGRRRRGAAAPEIGR
jgi:hypothetical protein